MREDLGLIDLSPFAKFKMEGADALAVLQRVSANDVDVPPGSVVYTQWLNEHAGIEADLTVSRLRDDRFLVVTSSASARRDWTWLHRHIDEAEGVVVTDVTAGEAVLGIGGPRARDFLSAYSSVDLSNAAFPFATWQEIELGRVLVRAQRLSYQGELGFELFVSSEFAVSLFESLMSGERAEPPRPVDSLAGTHCCVSGTKASRSGCFSSCCWIRTRSSTTTNRSCTMGTSSAASRPPVTVIPSVVLSPSATSPFRRAHRSRNLPLPTMRLWRPVDVLQPRPAQGPCTTPTPSGCTRSGGDGGRILLSL